tara:strand:+ start:5884 stop:6909 length:1026 start_codon:yes stop_codon:yes gene_type:complete
MFTDRRINSLPTKRERQHWPSDRTYNILSLDGGGIRGIFSAQFLKACEKEFGSTAIYKHFDCIAGTSTGGITALGLSIGMSTDEVVKFYKVDGRKIFPLLPSNSLSAARRFMRSWWKPKLDHQELENALKARFGDRLLGEAFPRLIIPAFMMPKTEIAVFKTDHHRDFKNDHLTPMWKVARSTAAAPTYLKGLEDQPSGKVFLDGGVWANNPVMVAIVDALSAYNLTFEQIRVLSIGTGNHPLELNRKQIFGGLVAWKQAVEAAMFLTTDNATAQAKLLLGPQNCIRFEPDAECANISMDDYDNAFRLLPSAAESAFDLGKSQIKSFFESAVPDRERHYSS